MSTEYVAVQWNRQKRWYDAALALAVGTYLAAFVLVARWIHPLMTEEILVMRALGSAAFLLLHGILCIGPLCRLDRRFLPLLYNRRHAGVTLGWLATVHGALAVATYHAGGDVPVLVSLFDRAGAGWSTSTLPFQHFGLAAWVILFLMAATSHDFWVANLGAPVWKRLHMLVYVAYALLVLHVVFGALQAESSPVYVGAVAVGMIGVLGVHLAAAWKERSLDRAVPETGPDAEGFVDVGPVQTIPEKRARIVTLSGERVAIFRYDGTISAVSNVCQHQNGPLGEGHIRDGCITCPWHGYQYRPETGASPPPFVERVPTFRVRVHRGSVWVHPMPNPAGTHVEPARIDADEWKGEAHAR